MLFQCCDTATVVLTNRFTLSSLFYIRPNPVKDNILAETEPIIKVENRPIISFHAEYTHMPKWPVVKANYIEMEPSIYAGPLFVFVLDDEYKLIKNKTSAVKMFLAANATLVGRRKDLACMCMETWKPRTQKNTHTVSVRALCNGRRVCRLSLPLQISKTKRHRREISSPL